MSQEEKVPEKFIDALVYWTGGDRGRAQSLAWMIFDYTGEFSTQGVSEEFISDALSLV